MILLRLYLLAGLITHKVVWEVLKRRPTSGASSGRRGGVAAGGRERQPASDRSVSLALVKAVKVAILLGLVAQTLAPEVLPITSQPAVVRVFGVAIYTAGLLIAILSRINLGSNWSDIESGRVLRDQAVVSRGIYAYVRHPIYVGDLLLLVGLELSLNSWLVLAVGLLAPVVLWKAIREEQMLLDALPGYDLYRARTKRFIPFVV